MQKIRAIGPTVRAGEARKHTLKHTFVKNIYRLRILAMDKAKTAKIKSFRPLRAAFVRERFLITDKQTEILNCKQTNGQTDERTDMTKCIISLASRSIISNFWTF